VVAHTEYKARLPIELSVHKGSRIAVIDALTRAPDWTFGVLGKSGRAGWFPTSHALPLEEYFLRLEKASRMRAIHAALHYRTTTTCDACDDLSCGVCKSRPPVVPPLEAWVLDDIARQRRPLFPQTAVRRREPKASKLDAAALGGSALAAFRCSKTGELMADPVMGPDGRSYQGGNWVHDRRIAFKRNHALRTAIAECVERQSRGLALTDTVQDQDRAQLEARASHVRHLEEKLSRLEERARAADTEIAALRVHCDLFGKSSNRRANSLCASMSRSSKQRGGEVGWLPEHLRRLRRLELLSPNPEGGLLSESVEDELENLIDDLAARRVASLGRWAEATISSSLGRRLLIGLPWGRRALSQSIQRALSPPRPPILPPLNP